MVKRYISNDEHGYDCAEESEHGDYVEWIDYAALAERCEKLEAALRECDAVLGKLGCDEDNSPRVEARALLSGSSGGKDG